ncbi:hypothetical protein SAMN05414138_10411 [Rhodoplanes sp. JGI PP 4-B12]|nr:hypothetical protein SAMN05414138_10411 [Rhodoplanes sp. JGI PP 4-B12]
MMANVVTAQRRPQLTKRFGTILRIKRKDRPAREGHSAALATALWELRAPRVIRNRAIRKKLIFSDGSKPCGKRICQKLVHKGVGLPRRRFVPGGDPRYICPLVGKGMQNP